MKIRTPIAVLLVALTAGLSGCESFLRQFGPPEVLAERDRQNEEEERRRFETPDQTKVRLEAEARSRGEGGGGGRD